MALIETLDQLIPHLADNSPGFAARLSRAGLDPHKIQTIEDLNALPVIRKDDLVHLQAADPPFGGFLATQPHQLKRIFQSPGPIYDPESRRPDYWRWKPALQAAGFERRDIVLNAFGYHLTPAGAMFEEGLWALGCTVIPAGVGNQEAQIEAMASLGITGYVGLPSYLNALLEKSTQMGKSLKIKKAFVTAEPLPPSLRTAINNFGVTIRQGYGTAECGNLGYECEKQDGWHLPDDALIQVCDLTGGNQLPTGEMGEIVVSLFNPDYALIRFGTGDLSALNVEKCSCGRTSPRLMGWQGRVGDAIKVRGIFVHPHQLVNLMKHFPQVDRWQARISRKAHKDELTLYIIPSTPTQVSGLNKEINQAAKGILRLNLNVQIVSPEFLPTNASQLEDTRTWE
jgi:phenylacetate-CoA ligase